MHRKIGIIFHIKWPEKIKYLLRKQNANLVLTYCALAWWLIIETDRYIGHRYYRAVYDFKYRYWFQKMTSVVSSWYYYYPTSSEVRERGETSRRPNRRVTSQVWTKCWDHNHLCFRCLCLNFQLQCLLT